MKSSSIERGKGFYICSNMICFETKQTKSVHIVRPPSGNGIEDVVLFGRFAGVRDSGLDIRDSKNRYSKNVNKNLLTNAIDFK